MKVNLKQLCNNRKNTGKNVEKEVMKMIKSENRIIKGAEEKRM